MFRKCIVLTVCVALLLILFQAPNSYAAKAQSNTFNRGFFTELLVRIYLYIMEPIHNTGPTEETEETDGHGWDGFLIQARDDKNERPGSAKQCTINWKYQSTAPGKYNAVPFLLNNRKASR